MSKRTGYSFILCTVLLFLVCIMNYIPSGSAVGTCTLNSCEDTTLPPNVTFWLVRSVLDTVVGGVINASDPNLYFDLYFFFNAYTSQTSSSPFQTQFFFDPPHVQGCVGPETETSLQFSSNVFPLSFTSAVLTQNQSMILLSIPSGPNTVFLSLTSNTQVLSMAQVMTLPTQETFNAFSTGTLTFVGAGNTLVRGTYVNTTVIDPCPTASSSFSSSEVGTSVESSSTGVGTSSSSETGTPGGSSSSSETGTSTDSSSSGAPTGSSSSSETGTSGESSSSSETGTPTGSSSSEATESSSSSETGTPTGSSSSEATESSSSSGAGTPTGSSSSSEIGTPGDSSSSSETGTPGDSSSIGTGTESSSSENNSPSSSESEEDSSEGGPQPSARPSCAPFPHGCPINGFKWPIPYYWGVAVNFGILPAFVLSINEDAVPGSRITPYCQQLKTANDWKYWKSGYNVNLNFTWNPKINQVLFSWTGYPNNQGHWPMTGSLSYNDNTGFPIGSSLLIECVNLFSVKVILKNVYLNGKKILCDIALEAGTLSSQWMGLSNLNPQDYANGFILTADVAFYGAKGGELPAVSKFNPGGAFCLIEVERDCWRKPRHH